MPVVQAARAVRRADEEITARRFFLHEGHVLRSHREIGRIFVMRVGQDAARSLLDAPRHIVRVLKRRRQALDFHLDLASHRGGDAAHDPLEPIQDLEPDSQIECADRPFERRLLRDDVEGRPAVEHGERDDRRLQRADVARYDALRRADHLHRGDDRVNGRIRRRAVSAPANEFDLELFRAGHDGTFGHMHPAERLFVPEVHREGHVHFGGVEHAVAQHHFRAARFLAVVPLLGRLEAEFDRACQLVAMGVKDFRHRQPNGGVTVVSAGVHDAAILRGVLRARFFDNWKRVHVEAQQEGWAGLRAFKQADDARPADAFGDFEAEGFEFLGDDSARANFAESQFGVHVKIAAQGLGEGK